MNDIIFSVHEHVLFAQFNRTQKRNALTGSMYSALADKLASANSDPEIRALLITGGELCFTAGNDLDDFLDNPIADLDAPVFRFMASVVEFQKPIIAAVCGAAIGIGTTLLAHCDLVFVTRQSKLGTPFVKLGLCPEFGSSMTLPAILGPVRARYMLLTGNTINGEQAVEWGFATLAVETAQDCLNVAEGHARDFARAPIEALHTSRELLRGASFQALRKVIQEEGRAFLQRLQSAEAQSVLHTLVSQRDIR
ncbi:hypothetical protein B1219_18265 [Pseudomonas ogarae]|uniref:enoyl-CoA hydratase-related protein n=1 Tax=Pseudomonas ogarae (strain DSM 112162 / CECT 30235 / F113) TaxID=1114970 RepID=UPI0009A41E66|nr:enoyl-CoA hydratase-related protein [Pseudomonas ogarae]OPG72103.1 hypothetical protein B1219_18265 [Pseudomonas ogarae]